MYAVCRIVQCIQDAFEKLVSHPFSSIDRSVQDYACGSLKFNLMFNVHVLNGILCFLNVH